MSEQWIDIIINLIILLKNFSPLAIASLIGSSYFFLDCLWGIIYHLFFNPEHPDFDLIPVEKSIGIPFVWTFYKSTVKPSKKVFRPSSYVRPAHQTYTHVTSIID
jgi:hypothetical protein